METSFMNKSGRTVSQAKEAQDNRLTYTRNYQPLEEDEIAQVREIFSSFDPGNS